MVPTTTFPSSSESHTCQKVLLGRKLDASCTKIGFPQLLSSSLKKKRKWRILLANCWASDRKPKGAIQPTGYSRRGNKKGQPRKQRKSLPIPPHTLPSSCVQSAHFKKGDRLRRLLRPLLAIACDFLRFFLRCMRPALALLATRLLFSILNPTAAGPQGERANKQPTSKSSAWISDIICLASIDRGFTQLVSLQFCFTTTWP